MTRRDIPNIISILRIALVLPVVMALLNSQFKLALLLFTVAGVSDALDGYIAKRCGYTSRLGSILDPLADKSLLICTYVALALLGMLPAWLVIAVVVRDMVILAGALAYHMLIGKYEMSPTVISKINTFAQLLLGLIIVLAAAGLYPLSPRLVDWLVYLVLATTIVSGADYVWTWGVRAVRARSRS